VLCQRLRFGPIPIASTTWRSFAGGMYEATDVSRTGRGLDQDLSASKQRPTAARGGGSPSKSLGSGGKDKDQDFPAPHPRGRPRTSNGTRGFLKRNVSAKTKSRPQVVSPQASRWTRGVIIRVVRRRSKPVFAPALPRSIPSGELAFGSNEFKRLYAASVKPASK